MLIAHRLILFGILILALNPAQAETLFYDNFQNASAGNWQVTGDGRDHINDYRGNLTLRLRKARYATAVVPVTGYRDLRIEIQVAAGSLENSDSCFGEYSLNAGDDWVPVIQVSSSVADGVTLFSRQVGPFNSEDLSSIHLRLRAAGNRTDDNCYFDDISVAGQALNANGGEPVFKVSEFMGLAGSGEVSRQRLQAISLFDGSAMTEPADMSAFALPVTAAQAANNFEGTISFGALEPATDALNIEPMRDVYNYLRAETAEDFQRLPRIQMQLIQQGGYLLPAQRGAVPGEHPHWEFLFEPGRVWNESNDGGWSRAAIPFALQERNANCIHNGVMSFLYKGDGQISKAAVQVSSETCSYFKFNLWGKVELDFEPHALDQRERLLKEFEAEILNQMPRKAISALAEDFNINTSAFGHPDEVSTDSMSLYGVVVEGINYVGGCETRQGPYPYCDRLVVPSYSTAKSLIAGLAFMRLQVEYPDLARQLIADWVPECRENGNWQDVTFENALDMVTGNYGLPAYHEDESSAHIGKLFVPETHAAKIQYSCNQYERKSEPGSRWVYHSSDTYILGTALNAYLSSRRGRATDIIDDVLVPDIWRPLNLSPVAEVSRRTYDQQRQPFTGWGLVLLADDIGKLAVFLNNDEASINGQRLLNSAYFEAAMQRVPGDRGPRAADNQHYNQGFWGFNLGSGLVCDKDLWVPFMSGYGGISIVLLPNGLTYYYFSDGDDFRWVSAAREANRFRNFCMD